MILGNTQLNEREVEATPSETMARSHMKQFHSQINIDSGISEDADETSVQPFHMEVGNDKKEMRVTKKEVGTLIDRQSAQHSRIDPPNSSSVQHLHEYTEESAIIGGANLHHGEEYRLKPKGSALVEISET